MANLLSLIGSLFQKHQGLTPDVPQTTAPSVSSPSAPDMDFAHRFLAAMKGGREGGIMGMIDGARGTADSPDKPRPVLKPRPTATPVSLPPPPGRPGLINPITTAPMDTQAPALSATDNFNPAQFLEEVSRRQKASMMNPTATTATDAQARPRELTALDYLNSIQDNSTNLPALPTYTPHEKHGAMERVIGFFRGGREGGLGAALEGATHPEKQELQDWLRTKYAPAMQQRQMMSKEQEAHEKIRDERLKALAEMTKALSDKKKADAPPAPHNVPAGAIAIDATGKTVAKNPGAPRVDTSLEFAREWNPDANGGKGAYQFIMGDDEQPMRSRQYLENQARIEAENKRAAQREAGLNQRSRYTQGQINNREAMKETGRNARHKDKPRASEKNFDDAIINDLINNEPAFKGKTPQEVQHILEMRGMKYIP